MTDSRLSIGEFARLCRLTVVALRHYDKVGVLSPAEIDRTTGYRYYRVEQVDAALRIGLLRSLGVSLADLRRLVTGSATLDELLAQQRAQLTVQIEERQRMIELLDAVARGADHETYAIERAVEPESRVVALTFETSWGRVESATRHGLARLAVLRRRVGLTRDTATGALFPVMPKERLEVTVFAAVAVADDLGCGDGGSLLPIDLPAVDAITTIHRGDHRLLGYAYHALLGHIAARGLEASGPAREYYETPAPPDTDCTRVVIPVGQNAP